MVKAFNEESGFISAGCFTHSLRLVIKKEVIEFPAVKEALDKARRICTHANKSTTFCAELRKQQRLQIGGKEKVLIQDVPTRWNSTFDMGERFLELKVAIISSLATADTYLVQLTKTDWTYLEKATRVLQVFKEATVMLSSRNASISQVIYIITLIMRNLKETLADHGVKQLKRTLKEGMEDRFDDYETQDMYALATYLDPRFKGFFFRNPENAAQAKKKIAEKLERLLMEEKGEQSQASINVDNRGESSMNKSGKNTLANMRAEIMKKSIHDQQNSPKMEVYNFLENYSNSTVMEEDSNVLDFWKKMSKSTKPIERKAAKLAEYYLTPPPSSVDVERLFSTAGDIITNERNRLLPDNAAKLLFLRENLPRVNYKY